MSVSVGDLFAFSGEVVLLGFLFFCVFFFNNWAVMWRVQRIRATGNKKNKSNILLKIIILRKKSDFWDLSHNSDFFSQFSLNFSQFRLFFFSQFALFSHNLDFIFSQFRFFFFPQSRLFFFLTILTPPPQFLTTWTFFFLVIQMFFHNLTCFPITWTFSHNSDFFFFFHTQFLLFPTIQFFFLLTIWTFPHTQSCFLLSQFWF